MSAAAKQSGCVFCTAQEHVNDADSLVLLQTEHNFILLNRYPYNNGHIMIAPNDHVSNPAEASAVVVQEMMVLAQRVLSALSEVYRPDGFNMGMNLGKCAGAGVEEHYHLHIVPRWNGDTNFMTAVAETRVIPESLQACKAKLKPYFAD